MSNSTTSVHAKSVSVIMTNGHEITYTPDQSRVYEHTLVMTWLFHPSGRTQREVVIPLHNVRSIDLNYGDQA